MKKYHIFLSCDDDILIDEDCIEKFLSKILKNGQNLAFESIKKHNNLEMSKIDLDELKTSSIFVVNTLKDMDNITYWELGYAMGKGLKIIGFWDGESSMKIPTDVKELISPIPSDIYRFVERINRALRELEPAEYSLEKDWINTKQLAVKDAQREGRSE